MLGIAGALIARRRGRLDVTEGGNCKLIQADRLFAIRIVIVFVVSFIHIVRPEAGRSAGGRFLIDMLKSGVGVRAGGQDLLADGAGACCCTVVCAFILADGAFASSAIERVGSFRIDNRIAHRTRAAVIFCGLYPGGRGMILLGVDNAN